MTQYYLFPVQDAPSRVVVSTPQGWVECQTHINGDLIQFNPTGYVGRAFFPDVTAYPIPADMLTTPRWSGWVTINRHFFDTNWETLEDSEDEGESEDEWEDYDSPDYEEAVVGLPLYEDVPPPPYEEAIQSPPAY